MTTNDDVFEAERDAKLAILKAITGIDNKVANAPHVLELARAYAHIEGSSSD